MNWNSSAKSWEVPGDHTCSFVDNGPAALELLHTLQPDIILIDYYMPGVRAPQVVEGIRQIPALMRVPLFIFCSDVTETIITGARELKLQGCLQKAPGFEQYRAQLAALLAFPDTGKPEDFLLMT